tara:strand:+ start:195 stop:443 length:249 start_codon:yes stop_codon:yes gene_type:complete
MRKIETGNAPPKEPLSNAVTMYPRASNSIRLRQISVDDSTLGFNVARPSLLIPESNVLNLALKRYIEPEAIRNRNNPFIETS